MLDLKVGVSLAIKRKIDEANDRIGRGTGYQSVNSSFNRSSSSNNSIKLGYIVAKSYKAGSSSYLARLRLVRLNVTTITNRSNIEYVSIKSGCLLAAIKINSSYCSYVQIID